jgi:hypothetical protein
LWATGRQIIAGDILNFAAHLQPADVGNFSRPGDVNSDGLVDADDLIAVILGWGPCAAPPSPCPADVDDNGAVDADDLILVILNWG